MCTEKRAQEKRAVPAVPAPVAPAVPSPAVLALAVFAPAVPASALHSTAVESRDQLPVIEQERHVCDSSGIVYQSKAAIDEHDVILVHDWEKLFVCKERD